MQGPDTPTFDEMDLAMNRLVLDQFEEDVKMLDELTNIQIMNKKKNKKKNMVNSGDVKVTAVMNEQHVLKISLLAQDKNN